MTGNPKKSFFVKYLDEHTQVSQLFVDSDKRKEDLDNYNLSYRYNPPTC